MGEMMRCYAVCYERHVTQYPSDSRFARCAERTLKQWRCPRKNCGAIMVKVGEGFNVTAKEWRDLGQECKGMPSDVFAKPMKERKR